MNHTWLFSRRFSLAEVGALCLLVAAVAGMTALLPQPPEASAEIGTAQQLGEKGATAGCKQPTDRSTKVFLRPVRRSRLSVGRDWGGQRQRQ